MKKFGSILVILLFVLGTAAVFAQDTPAEQPADQAPAAEAPAAEAPAAEAPAAEAPAAEAPAAEAPAAEAPAADQSGQLGVGAEAGAQSKVASPYINLTFLAGQNITDNAGNQLGQIQDAFLTSDGMVSHVIANVQNVPGAQPGTYVFPLNYFQYQNNTLSLNLPATPAFQQLSGAKSAGIIASDSIQASKLLSFNLVDQQGKNLGNIQDVIINMQDGSVSYCAVNFSGILGAGEKLFAVPYSEIWYNLNSQTVTIYNINQSALERNQGINMDNWPETADPNWNKLM